MTSSDTPTQLERSDAELIAAVRAGDNSAYGMLFERHRDAARRLARQLLTDAESEDLVSEAFTKVFVLLQDGKGPDLAFRAYLLTAIRRLHIDRIRAAQRVRTTDDEAELDRHVEFFDLAALNFERGTAADAFTSLPERWQLVLWHLDVEGQKPADIAPLLGMSANSVSALAYRAREGLRQAYLQHHLADTAEGDCRWSTERLGAFVRKGLSTRETSKVEEHLDGCRRCMGIYLELAEVNTNLSGILAPALLGTAAAGYLTAGSVSVAGATGVAAGVKAFILKSFIEPVKGAVSASPGAAAAAVATVVVASGAIAVAATGGFDGPGGNPSAGSAPAATAPVTPGPSAAPSATVTAPSDQPSVRTSTAPSDLPTTTVPEPTVVPVAVPTDSRPNETAPGTGPSDGVPPVDPPDPPPAEAGTDFGIGTIAVSGRPLFRHVSIPVTFTGAEPNSVTLTITVDFDGLSVLPKVTANGWTCGPKLIAGKMLCHVTQSRPEVPPLEFRSLLAFGGGFVTLTAEGDIDTSNNTASFP